MAVISLPTVMLRVGDRAPESDATFMPAVPCALSTLEFRDGISTEGRGVRLMEHVLQDSGSE